MVQLAFYLCVLSAWRSLALLAACVLARWQDSKSRSGSLDVRNCTAAKTARFNCLGKRECSKRVSRRSDWIASGYESIDLDEISH